MIRIFLRVEGAINRLIGHAASACLVVAAVSAFYQVVTRFVFEQPSTWSEALTRTCLIWMVFLGITIAFRHGALVAIDLAYRSVSGRLQTLLQGFITLGSISLLGVILWFGIQMTWRVRFQTLAGLEVPIAWAYAALPVGAFFSLLAVIAHYIDRRTVGLEEAAT
ncbi:MAG TPA: TRAP transporter small permease [Skermanella sp.]|jgi:C4-dicarboxylate transporter, DctQ subunit|nr:TRAP transporter small permease [Skermanella sp.]